MAISIINDLAHNVRVSRMAFDIVLVALLAVTVGATHDLRLAASLLPFMTMVPLPPSELRMSSYPEQTTMARCSVQASASST